MGKRSMFVGMDVHKESIDISFAAEGRDGEVRHFGKIAGDLEALAKVVKALRAPARRLRFVYEAGPCGFGIHRYLTNQGEEGVVVNPSSMPKRSGESPGRCQRPARRRTQSQVRRVGGIAGREKILPDNS
ncbi:MAG: hypothetical protein JW395_1634 [Nitrospira sp.]|nr:hypothetical protein [Nitrospira sp.]